MRRHDPSRVVHAAACTDRRRSRQELLPRLQEQELTTWADTVSIQPFPFTRFQDRFSCQNRFVLLLSNLPSISP